MTENESLESSEFKKDENPGFLKDLQKDNPDLAKEIEGRIPAWKKEVDEVSGVDGMGEAVLEVIDYVSEEEVRQHIDNLVDEIRNTLEEKPDRQIIFLAQDNNKGSQRWFYDEVTQKLSEEEIEANVMLMAGNLDPRDIDHDTVIFFADDNINSGSQFRHRATEIIYLANSDDRSVDFRVRCLRINEKGGYYNRAKRLLMNNDKVQFSLQANYAVNLPIKNGDNLRQKLGESANNIQNPEWYFNWGPASYETGAFTFFWHKIPDNIPAVVTGKDRFKHPLIKEEDQLLVANPYKKSIWGQKLKDKE